MTEEIDGLHLFDEVIPGEGMLLSVHDGLMIRQPGKPDVRVAVDDRGQLPQFRFLNSTAIAYINHQNNEVVVAGLDARPLHRHELASSYRVHLLPTFEGGRFAIFEYGYTLPNRMVNFLDLDDGRPVNLHRVRIVESQSGKELANLEWDPRPGTVEPAVSPNGHRIARVAGGILEVLEVP